MFKVIFLFFILGKSIDSMTQMVLHDPVTSKIFSTEKYSAVQGTPFYIDKWLTGDVTTPKGTYTNLLIKYDVYENKILFNKNEEPYEFVEEVLSFRMIPAKNDTLFFKRSYSIKDVKPNAFIQVLGEGKISIYRSDIKLVSDLNQINKGVVKTFSNSSRYYGIIYGVVQRLKPGKKELIEIMDDRQNEIEAFISSKKLSFKKDADITELLRYYNGL